MAQSLYTPFMAQGMAAIGQGFQQRSQNQRNQQRMDLTRGAYMGDPEAMQQLMAIDPKTGIAVQQSQRQVRQDAVTASDDRRKRSMQDQNIMKGIFNEAIKLPTYQQALEYSTRETESMADSLSKKMPPLPEEKYNQARQIKGMGPSFAGTGMEAQVSNILVKGTKDEAFLSTPEYARAYQIATEPKIIRTPSGDRLLQPSLPTMFKPPVGNAKQMTPEEQQNAGLPPPTPGTPKPGIVIIPGTGKVSADQKAYDKDYKLLKNSYDSMQNYLNVLDELGPQMAVGRVNAKDTQTIESAYSRAMLDAKETNNLGVLNGPDLMIMAKLMGNPIGLGGQWQGKEALMEGAKQAMKQITDNFTTTNEMIDPNLVKTRGLQSESDQKEIRPNDSSMSLTMPDGRVYSFPTPEQYQAAKAAAGLE